MEKLRVYLPREVRAEKMKAELAQRPEFVALTAGSVGYVSLPELVVTVNELVKGYNELVERFTEVELLNQRVREEGPIEVAVALDVEVPDPGPLETPKMVEPAPEAKSKTRPRKY